MMSNNMPLRPEDDRLLEEELSSLISGTQVPEDVQSSWRTAIRKETEMNKIKHFPWKSVLSIAAAALFLFVGVGAVREMDLGSGSRKSAAVSEEATYSEPVAATGAAMKTGAMSGIYTAADYDYEMMDSVAASADTADTALPQAQMLVYTASVNLVTKEFAADLAALQEKVTELGGYTEYLRQSGDAAAGQRRSATLTVRIPAAALDAFLSAAQGMGRVTSSNLSTENVTDTYADLATRLATLEAKRERLNELVGTTARLSDLLELESEISDTQYQIERIQGQMNSLNKQVSYSTVTLYLTEETASAAAQTETLSFGERIARGFEAGLEAAAAFLEDTLVFLVMAAPILVPLAILIAVIVIVAKKRKAKKNAQ